VIVPDASVVVELLLGTPIARRVSERLFAGESLHVPEVLYLEVTQALRRYYLMGDLTAQRGAEALEDLAAPAAALLPTRAVSGTDLGATAQRQRL
jgi:predicted nucleic acid-binding protein